MPSDGNGRDDGPEGVAISAGSTVLLQPGDDTDPLAFVGEWHSEPNLLSVAVDRSIQLFLADWRATVERTPADLGLVSVGESTRSATGQPPSGDSPAGNRIYTVADSTDLAAVERHVETLLGGWRARAEPTVVVVETVTGLLDVAPERDVAAFVAGLADLVERAGAVGFLTTCESARDVPESIERTCDDAIEATPDGWRLADRDRLSPGDAYALLADHRRRRVLQFLDGRAVATVEELADAITAGTDPGEQMRLAGSLVHVHLPKLDDAGVVDYDPDADVVEASDAVERLLAMVELVRSHVRE